MGMRRRLALGAVTGWLAACASAPPAGDVHDPNGCAFWLEAPTDERMAIVAATHERAMAGIEAKGVVLPSDWPRIKACVASRYSEQLRMIEHACRRARDPSETFQQTGALIYAECTPESPR